MRYGITELPCIERKYWESIFWRESTDYAELLAVCERYAQYWLSPLHESDDSCGKPHYHVIVGAEQKFCPYKKRSKYNDIVHVKGATRSKELNAGIAFPVDRLKSAIAYLVHLNNPEKQQFNGGLSEIVTNSPGILDEIVKREPDFDCRAWDEAHKPCSFMGSLGVIASEGFLTPSEACKLVTWYANHLDVFEGRESVSQRPEGVKKGEFWEVYADIPV